MATATEVPATHESQLSELETKLRWNLNRQTGLNNQLDDILGEVGRGDDHRSGQIRALLQERHTVEQTIESLKLDIERVRVKLGQDREKARREKLTSLLDRMAAKRQKIVELCQQAALLHGELHSVDQSEGLALVKRIVGDLDQTRFAEMLSPITPFSGREWTDSHTELPIGYDSTIRIPAMRKLGGDNAEKTSV